MAIHTNSEEDQEKLRTYKEAICKAAKCASIDVTQKWERLLFQGIKTKYVDLDLKEATITPADIHREVSEKHTSLPKKILMNTSPDGHRCSIMLFYLAKDMPPPNLTLFGARSRYIVLKDGTPRNSATTATPSIQAYAAWRGPAQIAEKSRTQDHAPNAARNVTTPNT